MKASVSRFTVRKPKPGDKIPEELLGQFSLLRDHIDWNWVWAIEHHASIEALIMTAPMHGQLFLVRVAATDCAPPNWLIPALRRVASESGFPIVTAWVSTGATEQQLMRIASKRKWLVLPLMGAWIAAKVEGI